MDDPFPFPALIHTDPAFIRRYREMRSLRFGDLRLDQGTVRETVNTTGISNPYSALAIYQFRVAVRIDVVDLRIASRGLADDLGQRFARRMPQDERISAERNQMPFARSRICSEFFLRIGYAGSELSNSIPDPGSPASSFMGCQNRVIGIPCKALNEEIRSGFSKCLAVRQQVEELPPKLHTRVVRQNPECAVSIESHLSDSSQLRIPPGRILLP